MLIETERLVLRLPTLDDAPAAGALLGDPEVMRFLGGEVVPPEAWQDVVATWLLRWDDNGLGPFVAESRDGAGFLGRVGIIVWDTRTWMPSTFAAADMFAQPELGWAFARPAWGHGYATEAAQAVLEWVRPRVDSLVSVIAPENAASRRVAKRLGARPAETVRLFDSGEAVVWRYAI